MADTEDEYTTLKHGTGACAAFVADALLPLLEKISDTITCAMYPGTRLILFAVLSVAERRRERYNQGLADGLTIGSAAEAAQVAHPMLVLDEPTVRAFVKIMMRRNRGRIDWSNTKLTAPVRFLHELLERDCAHDQFDLERGQAEQNQWFTRRGYAPLADGDDPLQRADDILNSCAENPAEPFNPVAGRALLQSMLDDVDITVDACGEHGDGKYDLPATLPVEEACRQWITSATTHIKKRFAKKLFAWLAMQALPVVQDLIGSDAEFRTVVYGMLLDVMAKDDSLSTLSTDRLQEQVLNVTKGLASDSSIVTTAAEKLRGIVADVRERYPTAHLEGRDGVRWPTKRNWHYFLPWFCDLLADIETHNTMSKPDRIKLFRRATTLGTLAHTAEVQRSSGVTSAKARKVQAKKKHQKYIKKARAQLKADGQSTKTVTISPPITPTCVPLSPLQCPRPPPHPSPLQPPQPQPLQLRRRRPPPPLRRRPPQPPRLPSLLPPRR